MNSKNIDVLNIGLIVISLIVAINLPFKLFLFSYVILGPLHYLTEITWLREKNYFFSAKKNWAIVFVVLTSLVAMYPLLDFMDFRILKSFEDNISLIGKQINVFLLIGFLFALGLLFFKKTKHVFLMLLFVVFFAFVSSFYIPEPFIFIGVFLPTLIHVYVFTLLFILYGAIKSKSKYGIYLGLVLLMIPFVIIYIPIDHTQYKPSDETMDLFISSNIAAVSTYIARLLNLFQDGKFYLLSEVALRIQIFIAFAYTYHYLNWFSKTSIIGWKNSISKPKAIYILALWILSVGLYMYDFETGFIALLFLSFLHVFLEFPLNVVTIKELLKITRKKT